MVGDLTRWRDCSACLLSDHAVLAVAGPARDNPAAKQVAIQFHPPVEVTSPSRRRRGPAPGDGHGR